MDNASRLRLRISVILAASGALGALGGLSTSGCGGKVVYEGSAAGSGGSGGSGAGGGTMNSTGTSTDPPVCASTTPTMQCFGAPGKGTAPDDCAPSVEDGCCNTSASAPFAQGGECCYWFCETACCGRPFTVEGQARVAAVRDRADWSGGAPAPGSAEIDEVAREALAAAWLADAQMEHASVASFARFTLELLALGAPAELVAASQRAALDEVEHARLSFGLASRLAGRALGPAKLDLDGALRASDLASCAAHAVREGCIGETVAALVARAQLDRAEDEGARLALARIAEDEEAHAALAYRFVAWALAHGDAAHGDAANGDAVRLAVLRAFEAGTCALREQRADRAHANLDAAVMHRFGRLTADEIDEVSRAALREVITPSLRALVGIDA